MTLVSFATFVLMDKNNVLDANTAFVSLSLFNIMRFPLAMLPMVVMIVVQAAVSIRRIDSFMNAEDLNPDDVSHDADDGKSMDETEMRRNLLSRKSWTHFSILQKYYPTGNKTDLCSGAEAPLSIADGNFSWGPGEPAVLKDVNLRVPRGSLVAVVGAVGAGKTSLLSALLGELERQSGRVNSVVSARGN